MADNSTAPSAVDENQQAAATATSEWFEDAARTKLFLAEKLQLLHGRELAYQRSGMTVSEVHADCLMLTGADIECDSLRASCAAAAILAAADDAGGEWRRRWRGFADEAGEWLEYIRAVNRLSRHLEVAFLLLATDFAAAVDGAEGGTAGTVEAEEAEAAADSEARRLSLLGDAMAALSARTGTALGREFDACRDCLWQRAGLGAKKLDIPAAQVTSWTAAASVEPSLPAGLLVQMELQPDVRLPLVPWISRAAAVLAGGNLALAIAVFICLLLLLTTMAPLLATTGALCFGWNELPRMLRLSHNEVPY